MSMEEFVSGVHAGLTASGCCSLKVSQASGSMSSRILRLYPSCQLVQRVRSSIMSRRVAGGQIPTSMGPQPFGYGNSTRVRYKVLELAGLQWATAFRLWKRQRQRSRPRSDRAFNGATAFRLWKPSRNNRGETSKPCLQWGHSLSAMETHPAVAIRGTREKPSMRPQPFGYGNSSSRGNSGYERKTFNGATAFRLWKLFLVRDVERGYVVNVSLQWGHSLSAMETGLTPLKGACVSRASMSFNGATAFRLWKHPDHCNR